MRRIILLSASMALALMMAITIAFVLPEEQAQAAFPGINGKIAFVSDRDGDDEIYTISFTGNNLKRLTRNTKQDRDPSWSADGKKIAFTSGLGDHWRQAPSFDLYVMNANGSNRKLVTRERSIRGRPAMDTDPSFSPSGRKIVFNRENESYDYTDIYKISVNGKKLTRLTPTRPAYGAYESGPTWSPKGNKIAFGQQDDDEYDRRLAIMNPDGSGSRWVTPYEEGHFPDWSPDGSELVATDVGGIYKIKVNGTGMTRLTTPRNSDHDNPAFSPGGGKIVFSSNRGGDYDLYIMDADGTNMRRLTNFPGDERKPSWQPIR